MVIFDHAVLGEVPEAGNVIRRRYRTVAVLALVLVSSGCGAGGVTHANPNASSSNLATPIIPSTVAPHRRSSTSSSPTPASNRVAPPGSYDDTSGTANGTPRTQTAVLTHLPGPAVARCVVVGARHDVRSGALAMGDFAAARATYAQTNGAYDAQPTHLYVIPESRSTRSATVTLTRIGGGAAPIRVRSDHAADAAQWRFFPVALAITRPGTWRIKAASGSAHGCFVVTFRR